jgi:hypothetical protein
MIGTFRHEASVALRKGHVIEAAIHSHIALRLDSPGPDVAATLLEVFELSAWLPVTKKSRALGSLEQKADKIRGIRKQGFDEQTEKNLIRLATEKAGRPSDTRKYAVRAWELRIAGQKWADIEGRFLPYRRTVENLGESMRREVQLLKGVLRRYGVSLTVR